MVEYNWAGNITAEDGYPEAINSFEQDNPWIRFNSRIMSPTKEGIRPLLNLMKRNCIT